MLNGLALSYTIFTIILVVVDLFFAFRSFHKGGLEGEYLGKCSLLAALVAFSYLISIIVPNYRIMSITSSIYFICIDWLLIMMIRFVTVYTTKAKEVITRPIMRIIQAYAVFETIVFAINPFKEIAISYVPRNTPIASYIYVMKPLYYMHLIFTYLMVIALLGILTRKILMTPRHYRLQYGLFIMAILFVVVINAFFILPIPMRHRSLIYLLDSSIPGYSLGLLIMYWSCFKYRDVYLKQGLSKMVFDNLEQGIALFDYDDFLVLSNDRLGDMIPSLKGVKDIKIDEFVDICGIGEHRSEAEDSYSISFFTKDNKEGRQLRCDFMRLKDEDGMALGKLFVYTDAIEEIDILTGFHSWDHFRQFVRDYPETFAFPYAVAEFDINGMGSINRNLGKEVGDDLLRSLASMIRCIMPEESYFVRGYDANLIAISYYITEEEMREYGDRITTEFTAKVQVGYSSSGTGSDDVLDRIADARRSMKIKKLLDDHSTHSQTITSLVRALKESDSDTEAHVKRTQAMGREIGRRIGLSDLEQSQLSLLCLLHDIGKVGIPLEILNKPGKLTREEWEVLKSHAEKGYQIAISSWELNDIAEMIRYHHERWDGKGYPAGLSGEAIPVLSRIISVVDSYDAMVNDRSYRKAISIDDAKAELVRCAGSQFDPHLTEEFLAMLEEMPDIAIADSDDVGDVHTDNRVVIPTMGLAPDTHGTQSLAREDAGISSDNRPAEVAFSRYIMDLDDRILSADADFEEITGYTGEDISGGWLTQKDLIPESQRQEYFNAVAAQLAEGDVVYMEHELVRKDGYHVYVLCFAKRHYDSASKTIRTEVTIVDSSTLKAFNNKAGGKA